MSKKITVRLKNRRASDAAAHIKAISEAVPHDADLDLTIEHEPASRQSRPPVRKDEQLETKVNAATGQRLDKLDELAKAAVEFKLDNPEAVRKSALLQAERRRSIRVWIADTAKAGWVTVVKVVSEALIKGGGPS